MASYKFQDLYQKYHAFYAPTCLVELANKELSKIRDIHVVVSDMQVELTSDYKASLAEFTLRGVYEEQLGQFRMDALKKYIALGTDVKIYMGHADVVREVFRGYIARVEFRFDALDDDVPSIHITAMDVKGQMMANSSSKRLKANSYSDAVKEIFDQGPYQSLKNRQIIMSVSVTDTPDKPPGGAGIPGGAGGGGGGKQEKRIEMVSESDYDFVVKAAKRFGYEFFSVGGHVVFRKPKANKEPLMELDHNAFLAYEIDYDITGLVETVNVRTVDVGKGKRIQVNKKNTNKISLGNKAKPLIAKQTYTYLDPTAETQDDATKRAEAILDDMSYRFGTLTGTVGGLPEITPGRFIKTVKMGDGVSNTWYVTDVTHTLNREGVYRTTFYGRAAAVGGS